MTSWTSYGTDRRIVKLDQIRYRDSGSAPRVVLKCYIVSVFIPEELGRGFYLPAECGGIGFSVAVVLLLYPMYFCQVSVFATREGCCDSVKSIYISPCKV